MTSCAEGHHTAFVIMPFGAEFDEIYTSFIHPVLTNAGFEVHRADELTSAESIMGTIIRQLEGSCIIVADLSDSNPNVYYELGLAHAMHKPVINLAQAVDELPFDIRGHYVIPYSTYFSEMDKAKKDLANAAEGVFTGATTFGNPFSDHSRHDVVPTCRKNSEPDFPQNDNEQSTDQNGPLGILDHHVAMEEGFQEVRDSTEEIGVRTAALSDSMTTLAGKLNALQRDRSPNQARRQRDLVRSLAQEMDSYASFMSGANGKYSEAIERSRPALEAMLVASEDDPNDIQDLLGTLDTVEQQVVTFQETTNTVATVISELPDVEGSFMRARDRVVDQLRQLAGNVALIVAMIARTRELARLKLAEQAD